MDTADVISDSLREAKALSTKNDYIFRLETGSYHRFLVLPREYLWYAYSLALSGTTIHEVMTRTRRIHFDIETDVGSMEHMAYGRSWDDHEVVGHLAGQLRAIFHTRVMVTTASTPKKISYHVWCLDTAAKNLSDHKQVLSVARSVSYFPHSMFDSIYSRDKCLRIYESDKNGEGRPLVFVPEVSDDIPEGETWKYVQGPFIHLISTGKDQPAACEGVNVDFHDKYDIARDALVDVAPDLVLSAKADAQGGYRAGHGGRGWYCPICSRVHENDGAMLYVKETVAILYCFRAASEDRNASLRLPYT